jgi:hypothetical protein
MAIIGALSSLIVAESAYKTGRKDNGMGERVNRESGGFSPDVARLVVQYPPRSGRDVSIFGENRNKRGVTTFKMSNL